MLQHYIVRNVIYEKKNFYQILLMIPCLIKIYNNEISLTSFSTIILGHLKCWSKIQRWNIQFIMSRRIQILWDPRKYTATINLLKYKASFIKWWH